MGDHSDSKKDESKPVRGLARACMRAETLDQAFAAVVKKVREDTKAEHVYFIARDDEGKLVKKSHAGPPKPPFQVREHAFAKAKAALDRLAARRKEAADKGEDVRELGTDVPEDVTSHATSVWLPERDFGAIAIVRLGQKPFTFDELDALWEAAASAAIGLARRYVAPSGRGASNEAEPDEDPTPRIFSPELAGLVAVAKDFFVGSGDSYLSMLELVDAWAKSDEDILIRGESGTGKDCMACLFTALSPRAKRPFVVVNVATLSEDLFESELFGYVKGAFTGAAGESLGLVGKAEGGTLFLDEIGELRLSLQAKLLRFLEKRKARAVGGVERDVNVRVIAATNASLGKLVKAGKFREDLYYRLTRNAILKLPPLRERKDELSVIIDHLLEKKVNAKSRPKPVIAREAMALLRAHDWPGNVRELDGVLNRVMRAVRDGKVIEAKHVSAAAIGDTTEDGEDPGGRKDLDDIASMLADRDGNVSRTARDAGIHLSTLQRMRRR